MAVDHEKTEDGDGSEGSTLLFQHCRTSETGNTNQCIHDFLCWNPNYVIMWYYFSSRFRRMFSCKSMFDYKPLLLPSSIPGCEALLNFQLHYVAVQSSNASEIEKDATGDQTTEKRVLYAPIVVARATNLLIEGLATDECTLCQLKVEVS